MSDPACPPRRRGRSCTSALVRGALVIAIAWLAAPAVGQDLPTGVLEHNAPVHVTRSRDRVPPWMEVPREARLRTGDGLTFAPLRNSAISYENLKLGVLVGVLRNDGPCAQNLSARWEAMSPMSSSWPKCFRMPWSTMTPRAACTSALGIS